MDQLKIKVPICPLTRCVLNDSFRPCLQGACAWFRGENESGRCAILDIAEALGSTLDVYVDQL